MNKLSSELSTRSDPIVWLGTISFIITNSTALLGNLSVCYAVYRNQRLRTLANVFVVALAVSDILMSTCCMPFSVATSIAGRWLFGDGFCRFHGFCVFTFGLASLLTMGIIAVNRYFRIVKPEKYIVLFKTRTVLLYLVVVWCTAFIGSVPPLFFDGFQFHAGKEMCLYTFRSHIAYTVFIECVYIATPLIVISVCYAKVFYTVSRSNRVFAPENNPQQLRANVEEAKVTKTLAVVMVGFAICWIPVSVIDCIDAAQGKPTLQRQAYLTYGFLVYFSSTINPFIYGVTNRQFRREYKAILKKVFCLRSCRCTRRIDNDVSGSGTRA